MSKSKLNEPTLALVKIDTDTHPVFANLWADKPIVRIRKDNFETFRQTEGLALLFLVDEPEKFKETLDMAVIAPEIVKLFAGTLSAVGFTDPSCGRVLASSLGINRLPSVAVFCMGKTLGSIDGLRCWSEYETELVKILTQSTAPKKTVVIAPQS